MREKSSNQRVTKRIALILFGVILPVLLMGMIGMLPAGAETAKHYTELTFPPLPNLKIPNYSRFQLANGMTVYLMEDHELPLVHGTALVRTGDRFEPADKLGLATMTGVVMRSGGTQQRSPDALNQFLEQRAASVETGIGESSGYASFSTLTEDLDDVFKLFVEVIRQPVFPTDKIALEKNQQQGGIARRNDEPGEIAGREFAKLLYGTTSPYARTVEYATLDNISQDDLVKFYRRYFHPNTMILGIVGDFDSAAMRSRIEAQFGDWPAASDLASPSLPAVSQAKTSGIFMIHQPQLTQSNVLIGHLGGQLNHPDYAALSVMNGVLNGLGGRLFNEVRSRQGLAYSVYAFWSPEYDYPGTFTAGGQTRSNATVPFIQSVLHEIDKIRTTPITPSELAFAKDSVLNSFIFNFQDADQILSRLLGYEYYGYPSDFIFRYQKGVAATTIADVQRVAKTYLQPENLVTLVVGNETQIQPPLSRLNPDGKVAAIDITIPPAPKH